jgi:phosphoglycolate phosphatase
VIELGRIVIGGEEVSCELVLFDLDGTLLDDDVRYGGLARARFEAFSGMAGREAAERWAELSGVDVTDFSVDKGGPLAKAPRSEDIVVGATALFLSGVRWFRAMEEAAELYGVADRLVEAKYRPILFEGVEAALRELRGAGLGLGIATNGSGVAARGIMASLGLEGLFDVIVGADDVDRGKPAPDMILLACGRAGVEPGVSVYVGDAPADMMAGTGRAAGCGALVAVNNVGDEELTGLADVVVGSVADFRVA